MGKSSTYNLLQCNIKFVNKPAESIPKLHTELSNSMPSKDMLKHISLDALVFSFANDFSSKHMQ